MKTHIILPDVHTKPNIPNDRLEWAGNLCLDRKPEVIVCLGDFYDFESLSSYDKGRKSFEGRRYRKDIEAGIDGLKRFNKPLDDYNESAKKNKKAQYNPRKVMLIGNHEQRLERVTNLHPELEGTLTFDNLCFKAFGWEVVPFLQPIEIDKIWYCHYFVSGLRGEAVSGINVGSALLQKNMVSSTVGHNHILDWAVKATPDGRKMMGLSGGCYLDANQHEDYAHATEFLWWRGLIIKNNVIDGSYDLETMHIDRVKQLYS